VSSSLHLPERPTLAISHHGYVLSKGRVVAGGTPEELARRDEVREAYFG
jgi:branched-chain amino acid transport system ATP-binding protein